MVCVKRDAYIDFPASALPGNQKRKSLVISYDAWAHLVPSVIESPIKTHDVDCAEAAKHSHGANTDVNIHWTVRTVVH